MSESAAALMEVLPCPRPRAAARQAWTERLARFSASGLRPAEFCAAEGVSLPSFYSWKRRLVAGGTSPAAEPLGDTPPPPRLLPVRLPCAPTPLELVLPGGAVLRIPPGSDLAFVRSLLAALGVCPTKFWSHIFPNSGCTDFSAFQAGLPNCCAFWRTMA
jgi:hypothetical protein